MNARYAMVMPVLDAAAFLEESLSSVFDQSMPATELYVVDDNSKDDSVQIIRSFGPEITLLRNTSPGMPAALNLAIARCQSDFISFLDSDDVWLPTKSERQIQVLDGKPEVDVVCGAVINFKMKGEEDDVSSFERRFPPCRLFTASMFRRETLKKFGLLDLSAGHFGCVYDWWSRAEHSGISTVMLDEVVLRRRIHESNSWVRDWPLAERTLLDIARRNIKRHPCD